MCLTQLTPYDVVLPPDVEQFPSWTLRALEYREPKQGLSYAFKFYHRVVMILQGSNSTLLYDCSCYPLPHDWNHITALRKRQHSPCVPFTHTEGRPQGRCSRGRSKTVFSMYAFYSYRRAVPRVGAPEGALSRGGCCKPLVLYSKVPCLALTNLLASVNKLGCLFCQLTL